MNEQNHVPTILAVSCQKGGEGKTTSAWHIGAALTQRGYKVCLIDCDPDHHLSFALGWQDDGRATLTNLVLMAIVMGNSRMLPQSAIQSAAMTRATTTSHAPKSWQTPICFWPQCRTMRLICATF